MKKFIFLAAIAATVVASCAKDPLAKEEIAKVKEGMVPYTATVEFDATKSTIDGLKIVWEVGDTVAIFDDYNTEPNRFLVSEVNDGGAVIQGEISEYATKLYGVYPFSAADSLTFSEDFEDSMYVRLPSVQMIEEGKVIASDALVTVAGKTALGKNLRFWNPISVLKFTLPVEGVNKVVFSGLDGKGVTGNQVVALDSRETFARGETSLTISKPDCFEKDAAYYAVVLPRSVDGLRFVLTAQDFKANVESEKTAVFIGNSGIEFAFNEEQLENDKFPLNIYTWEDLNSFAAHSDMYDAGDWVNLCADIDYDHTWTAVADFEGNFNGGGHSIYGSTQGLTFEANSKYPEFIGFFSKVYAEVKDLKLGYSPELDAYDGHSDLRYQENIKYAGPLAGSGAERGNGVGPVKITNVQNYVEHHANFTTKTSKDLRAGNLIGDLSCPYSEVNGCANYAVLGNISALNSAVGNQYLGGLFGMVDKAHHTTITDCANYGSIKNNTKTSYTVAALYISGGIVGRTSSGTADLKFVRCVSAGDIIDASTNTKMQNFLGGILGADNASAGLGSYDIIMEACRNECKTLRLGSQTGRSAAGGMIGYAKSSVHLKDCVNGIENVEDRGTMPVGGNTGTSTSAGYGGMIGIAECEGIIGGCTNYAPIAMTAGKSVSTPSPKGYGKGGIIGIIMGSATLSVQKCINYGDVVIAYTKTPTAKAGAGIGGIVGANLTTSAITNCENYGDIKEDGGTKATNAGVGGLIGYQVAITKTAAGCKVDCEISSKNPAGMIAGIVTGNSTFGDGDNKFKVRGILNKTTLTKDNFMKSSIGDATGKKVGISGEYWE